MMKFKRTVSVEIEVSQDTEFSSDLALHQWIAHCLNCNTNNRKVTVTVGGDVFGPEIRQIEHRI